MSEARQVKATMPPQKRYGAGPSLTTLAMLGRAVQEARNDRPRPAEAPRRKSHSWRPKPKGIPMSAKELMPFIVKIISEHKRHRTRHTKRIQCVVRFLGLTKTMHLDVPLDFNV